MWWTCEKVKNYWTQVWELVKEITQQKLDIKPEMAFLNVIPGIDKKLKHCLMYILIAGRHLWAQKWKSRDPNDRRAVKEAMGHSRTRHSYQKHYRNNQETM